MIDLHLHTSASDGRYPAAEVVLRAHEAGITTLSVTDHDTTAGLDETARAAAPLGIEYVPGIEITAVWRRKDLHVLGYFFDPRSPGLQAFLVTQRQDRIRRFRAMVVKVAELGLPVDVDALVERAQRHSHHSLGRPLLADALVSAGYVADRREAFDRYLGDDCAAFVPRAGASPEEVVGIIAGAGGIASLAHPGLLGHDEVIPSMVASGLQAIEAYHSKHAPATVLRYVRLAEHYGLAVSGGSDFHGDGGPSGSARGGNDSAALGCVALPRDAFDRLRELAVSGARARSS